MVHSITCQVFFSVFLGGFTRTRALAVQDPSQEVEGLCDPKRVLRDKWESLCYTQASLLAELLEGDVDQERAVEVGGVSRQRNGVQAGAADGGIGQQGVHRNASLGPALRKPSVFKDRKHQPVVAGLLHFHVLDSRSDGSRSRHRPIHAKWLLG